MQKTRRCREEFSKGKQSELAVLLALQRLRDTGDITRFYCKDEPGIDFHVAISGHPRRMPLQVKSSDLGRRYHVQNYPHIPCVVVHQESKGSTIQEELIQKVSQDIRACIEEFRRRQ